jgi:MinD superfamily P-loop ATPase
VEKMRIAIASGKGGTGKTTLSVNLAYALEMPVQLLDCDVEEPNSRLFLEANEVKEEVISIPVPEVDEALCDSCGECAKFCEYNAIAVLGTKPMIFPEMCHGCGGCMRICPQSAIKEVDNRIGTVKTFESGEVTLLQGCLDVGAAMAPPLIHAVKKRQAAGKVVILDAPPGTSCPVIAAIQDVDFVVLITEPTPFGLNDLVLAVDMVRVLSLPFGVVINRVGAGDNRVHDYCAEENIPVILEIPDDRRIAEAYSRGELIVQALPEYKPVFVDLHTRIKKMVEAGRISVELPL